MNLELTDNGGVGEVKYLVFEENTEPYVAELPMILEDVKEFTSTKIYLITPGHQLIEVRVESTDGEPDYMDWETVFNGGDLDGELCERAEYEDGKPRMVKQNVHGFVYA